MHQTVGRRKHFLRTKRTFVCTMFEGEAARYEQTDGGAGTAVILKQNRRLERTNRAQIDASAFAFIRDELVPPVERPT